MRGTHTTGVSEKDCQFTRFGYSWLSVREWGTQTSGLANKVASLVEGDTFYRGLLTGLSVGWRGHRLLGLAYRVASGV